MNRVTICETVRESWHLAPSAVSTTHSMLEIRLVSAVAMREQSVCPVETTQRQDIMNREVCILLLALRIDIAKGYIL